MQITFVLSSSYASLKHDAIEIKFRHTNKMNCPLERQSKLETGLPAGCPGGKVPRLQLCACRQERDVLLPICKEMYFQQF